MHEIIKQYSLDWKDMINIVIGSFILSVSFQVFFLPNDIISGGVSSLSIILYNVIEIEPAYIQYAFNVPLLLIGYFFLGKEVALKSILGSLLFPFFTSLVSDLGPLTDDKLLAALFGGVLTGIGLGMVYKAKGSTGGTSIVAQIIAEYTHMTLGNATLIADGAIILIGLFVFDLEAIMYGIISLFVISRVIDIVLVGSNTQKTVLIISDETEKIRLEILEQFNRGVTLLDIKGGYRKEPKEMMMVVIQEREITALQQMIIEQDDDAFVVVMSASEVMGRGFSLEKYFPANQ